uniref:Ankyrin repeat and SOCS box containing 10 n=1 Tax=Podarcis muralis TaxID=64176 RepID=A0A670J985_PODMU
MSRSLPSSSSSSRASRWRSLGLDAELRWRWEGAKSHVSCQGPVASWGRRTYKEPPSECRDMVVQNALYTGDLDGVQRHFSERAEVNLVIHSKSQDLRWTSQKWGLWSLTYEQELTTPLHITASRGYLECLRHLLLRGADVDLAPGGRTALHEACAAATTDCVRLLLSFGADPLAVSEGGLQPLHLCRSPASLECARLLLCHGARVNCVSEEEEDTPLHLAARLGLAGHVRLFLSYGASLEARNAEGQTPLNAACAQAHPPEAVRGASGPGGPGRGRGEAGWLSAPQVYGSSVCYGSGRGEEGAGTVQGTACASPDLTCLVWHLRRGLLGKG